MCDRRWMLAGGGVLAVVLVGVAYFHFRTDDAGRDQAAPAESRAETDAVVPDESKPPVRHFSRSELKDLVSRLRTGVEINKGLDRGLEFLRKHQSKDGGWRSDAHPTFKHGAALTPLVLVAIQRADAILPDVMGLGAKRFNLGFESQHGAKFLADLIDENGTLKMDEGVEYPVYLAAHSILRSPHSSRSVSPLWRSASMANRRRSSRALAL